MKIKVSEATPLQLDWLVAKIEGWLHFDATGHPWDADNSDPDGEACWFEPSTNWAQGGPIVEREIARLEDLGDEGWEACGYGFTATGPTPLIAAMRCFVSSRLGDEVEVPEELFCNT